MLVLFDKIQVFISLHNIFSIFPLYYSTNYIEEEQKSKELFKEVQEKCRKIMSLTKLLANWERGRGY